MKFAVNLIITALLSIVLNLFLPWWSIMLAAFITGFVIDLKGSAVFLAPFLGVLFLWMVYGYLLSSANDFILSTKIANLLPLGGNVMLLTLITGVVGGIAAGVAGFSGKQLKMMMSRD